MKIVRTDNLSAARVYTSVHARVYQMFARLEQKSEFLIKMWSACRPLISAGNQIKGREMLRNVKGEIEYSDNGNHLRSTELETGPSHILPSGVIAGCPSHFLLKSRITLAPSQVHVPVD